ncbi:MAG: amidohydrolase family protein [Parcubacteria group bacterium]
MKSLAIVNIGTIVSGDLEKGILDADNVICQGGVIIEMGRGLDVSQADTVVDAKGTTVIPGLIDSHCHTVLGDYTPRQKQIDFLDSYVHGGITSVVTAGEGVHAPGRPHDPIAAKCLAIAAFKCFENFRPNGMKVHGGSVLLEPGLTEDDFIEMAKYGVQYAKFGFGDYSDPCDGVREVQMAQKHGMLVMAHSGGTSLPGSSPISEDILLHLKVDVCGHINGGTTSLHDDGVARVITESDMALQLVQAGNLRSALHIISLAQKHGALNRVCIGSDTPSGTGVMPLGVFKTICELSSLGSLPPEKGIALATGNNARIFKLSSGVIEVGRPADLIICDAPAGSVAKDALGAIARGDIPGISAVIIDGRVQVGRSRNTPLARRLVGL